MRTDSSNWRPGSSPYVSRRPVRRSALISPWGVGSTVDFPNDESLMTCGLDAWPLASEPCPPEWQVVEERLQRRLGVDHLRLPPDFRTPAPGVRFPGMRIPFVRFPQWHYCPRCGNLTNLGLFGEPQRCDAPNWANGLSCRSLPERRRPRLQPSRFIAVCKSRGHILDFPFLEWVHREVPPMSGCRLRLRAGRTTSSLAGIKIECTCGQKATMAGVFEEGALARIGMICGSERPWLGEADHHERQCGDELAVLQRGASNVYFAHVASSIYLPLWAEKAHRPVIEALEDTSIWTALTGGLVDGKIDPLRCTILCQSQPWRGLDPQELLGAAQRKLEGIAEPPVSSRARGTDRDEEEELYRQAEYDALRTGRGTVESDLATEVISSVAYGEPICSFFAGITLVKKLRETRALYGFSRYLPDDIRTYSEQIADLRLDDSINWLPAVVVRGEGVFFELRREALEEWSERAADRISELERKFNDARLRRQQTIRTVRPAFVLLHTLAHLLINQLSYDCGYGSSSLRERIYCDIAFPDHPMTGFLIYTASGDAEGTMGGLVRQGEPGRLEITLERALHKATWCSYDPICMESSGQGPDSCNLAACHGCAVLPETSCEEGNRLLDRALVVGTPGIQTAGLFSRYLE